MPQNFKIVIPNQLYRSGQVAPSEIKTLIVSPLNVKRIVSLDQSAGDLIHSYIPAGIEHIMFPLLEGSGSLESRKLSSAIKQNLLNANGATLVHCMQGKDRTGLAIALYRVIKQGWSCTQAIEEAKSMGYGTGIPVNVLNQYNAEICSNCGQNHKHYCQVLNTQNTTPANNTDTSQADDAVNLMRDNFSHQDGWNSVGLIVPISSNNLSFAPFTDSSSEGALGAKTSSKSRKAILKKIIKILDEQNEDKNAISLLPDTGLIDNYGGTHSGNAPSGTPGSANSAAFTADPTGLIQL